MKSRNALSFTSMVLALTLSAPIAFAQDQNPSQTAQEQAAEAAATPATPATPASPAATPSAPGQEAKKITWSDLDADKDGKLTKDEAGSVQALVQVFDAADADKDGALTPAEYKAYVAKHRSDAAQPQPQG